MKISYKKAIFTIKYILPLIAAIGGILLCLNFLPRILEVIVVFIVFFDALLYVNVYPKIKEKEIKDKENNT